MLASVDPTQRLQRKPPNVAFIDLNDYFCTATTCLPAVGNVIIYRDGDHITATYARTLAPILAKEFQRAVPAKWLQPNSLTASQREPPHLR
jgi:hypothetical protein